jgi:glycerol-3-phosphate cytidylyltransferase
MGLVVYTGGTFDLPHSGHVNFLRKCAQLGKVYVSLNTDEFIEQYKGKPPVMTFNERYEVLTEYHSVHVVMSNDGGADSKDAILQVRPDIIAIGSDWARKDYYKQMGFTQDWLDEQGISLIYIPYTEGISSTEIKRRLKG